MSASSPSGAPSAPARRARRERVPDLGPKWGDPPPVPPRIYEPPPLPLFLPVAGVTCAVREVRLEAGVDELQALTLPHPDASFVECVEFDGASTCSCPEFE